MPRNEFAILKPGSTDGKYFHLEVQTISVKDAKTLVKMVDVKNPKNEEEAALSSKFLVMAGETVPDSVWTKTKDKKIVEPEVRKVFAGTPIVEGKKPLDNYMKARDREHNVEEGRDGALRGNHAWDFQLAKEQNINTGNMVVDEDERDAKIRKLEDDLEQFRSVGRRVCAEDPTSPAVRDLSKLFDEQAGQHVPPSGTGRSNDGA